MAYTENKKADGLDELTSLDTGDLVIVADSSDSYRAKKITKANSFDLKANLVSPTLTGTPTAPTPSASDNSTKIATTAYVDSGIATAIAGVTIPEDQLRVATVLLSSTDILAGYVTPKTLISAPGVGKLIVVDSVVYEFTAGTKYTGGGNHQIRYNGDSNDLVNTGATTYQFTNASNFIYKVVPISSGVGTGVVMTAGINKAVEWSNSTGAYATGNGTAKIFIKYRIITL